MNLFRLAVGIVLQELRPVATLGVVVVDDRYLTIEYASPAEFHSLVWVTPLSSCAEPPLVEVLSPIKGAWCYAKYLDQCRTTWSP